MQRARRLASIAAVLVTGAVALTGCRASPGVAAYVGDDTYTEARITQIYDDANEKLQAAVREQAERQAAAGASPTPAQTVPLPITRKDILMILVGRDLYKRAADAMGIAKVDVPTDQLVQQRRLPGSAEFMQLLAEHEGYRLALADKLPPKPPTEAELRDIYDRLVAGGGYQGEPEPFAKFAAELSAEDRELLATTTAVREALTTQVRAGDVLVNPRYTPAEVTLLSFTDRSQVQHPLITVPIEADPDEPFVRDAA